MPEFIVSKGMDSETVYSKAMHQKQNWLNYFRRNGQLDQVLSWHFKHSVKATGLSAKIVACHWYLFLQNKQDFMAKLRFLSIGDPALKKIVNGKSLSATFNGEQTFAKICEVLEFEIYGQASVEWGKEFFNVPRDTEEILGAYFALDLYESENIRMVYRYLSSALKTNLKGTDRDQYFANAFCVENMVIDEHMRRFFAYCRCDLSKELYFLGLNSILRPWKSMWSEVRTTIMASTYPGQ